MTMFPNQNVTILPAYQLGLDPAVTPALMVQGDIKLLTPVRAAIINSRKPEQISPKACWFQATVAMTREALAEDCTVISSLGPAPYELVAFLTTRAHRPLILVCDGPLPLMLNQEEQATLLKRYRSVFDPCNTLFVSPFLPGRALAASERLSLRDQVVVGLAEKIRVAEVRAGGRMEKLVSGALHQGIPVQVFVAGPGGKIPSSVGTLLSRGAHPWSLVGTESNPSTGRFKKTFRRTENSPGSPEILPPGLAHFTRSCPGPWPGQTLSEYYEALIERQTEAGHTALDTLRRILNERRLRASDRIIRGHRPVVSFTRIHGDRPVDLVRWRSTLHRWTVEPYGLIIREKTLKALGATPAIYGDESTWERLPLKHRYRFQVAASGHLDWRREKEWRLAGDLDLSLLSADDVIVVVPTTQESLAISAEFGHRTLAAGHLGELYARWCRKRRTREMHPSEPAT